MNAGPDSVGSLPWEHPGWFDEVAAWIHARLAGQGFRPAGPLEIVHQRPWSAFARLSTSGGPVYFKAPSPPFRYEAALSQALANWQLATAAPLLGVDLDRGWILTADAGTTLRILFPSAGQIPHWLDLLPRYAEFQMALADRVPELLAFRVPDRRLTHLPGLYARLLQSTDDLRVGLADGLTPEQHRRLLDLSPRFEEMCARLAGFNLPETLVHEELHENNVLLGDGRYVYTDWSDCSVGPPFFTMLVTLRSIAAWRGLDERGPELARVRDAYLEPWTRYEPRPRLSQALDLALRLGMVNRALSWQHGLQSLTEKQKEAYADSVPGWLQDFLEAETLS